MANLTQIARIIKSEVVLTTVGILAIGIFALAIFGFINRDKTPKTPPATPWQNNIYAGTTTRNDLESALGQPKEIEEANGNQVYLYPSADEFRSHEITLSQDKVALIKEQVLGDEKGKLQDYAQKYGPAEAEVYGRHGTFAPGHFWGNAGILVFANKVEGGIAEIWYFQPTTLAAFLNQNPELKTEEPTDF